MQKLKNWDNKTWLSSKRYISNFNKFLKLKVNLNKNSKILDIGCGRANIISALQNKYKFKTKPTGIDIIKNKDLKKNIVFKKFDGIKYLKNEKQKFDLILIKQTIHFFSKKKLNILLNLSKKNLNYKGTILISL
jgi:Methyltransferase domain.